MNKLLLLLIIPLTIMAATITGEYEYTYGDNESLVEARKACNELALRNAIESFATFISSKTEIEDFVTKKDQIVSVAKGVVKDVKVVDKKEDKQKNTIFVKISCSVDEKEVLDLLSPDTKDYGSSKTINKELILKPKVTKGQVIVAFEKAYPETIWKEKIEKDSLSYYVYYDDYIIDTRMPPEEIGWSSCPLLNRTYLNEYNDILIGDLNYDGIDDAAISYIVHYGGTSNYESSYAVFINEGGELKYACSFTYDTSKYNKTNEVIQEIKDGAIKGIVIKNQFPKPNNIENDTGIEIYYRYINGKLNKKFFTPAG